MAIFVRIFMLERLFQLINMFFRCFCFLDCLFGLSKLVAKVQEVNFKLRLLVSKLCNSSNLLIILLNLDKDSLSIADLLVELFTFENKICDRLLFLGVLIIELLILHIFSHKLTLKLLSHLANSIVLFVDRCLLPS